MKKNIMIIILIIINLFCIFKMSQNNTSNETNMDLDTSLDKYNIFNSYEITGNISFGTIVSKNKIDNNYDKEFYEEATSTSEMVNIQTKYLDIWRQELGYSISNYTKLLTASDKELFVETQQQWEYSILSNLELEHDILLNNMDYAINMGSSFNYLYISQIREAYRERTIRIKYLTYLIDEQDDVLWKYE